MNSHELLPLLPFLASNTGTRTNALEISQSVADGDAPRTFLLRGEDLASAKQAALQGDAVLVSGLEKLRELVRA